MQRRDRGQGRLQRLALSVGGSDQEDAPPVGVGADREPTTTARARPRGAGNQVESLGRLETLSVASLRAQHRRPARAPGRSRRLRARWSGVPGAELRAAVDRLEADVAARPTDASTIAERARVLAEWVDAYAMAGREVGIDGPGVRIFATLPPTGTAGLPAAADVDRLVREFTLRDEEGALGELRPNRSARSKRALTRCRVRSGKSAPIR